MTTVKDLGPVIMTRLSSTVASRFSRILAFYEGNGNDVDVVKGLKCILDDPDAWKRTDDLLKRWTTVNSIGDVYASILKVLEIPEIVAAIGDAGTVMQLREAHIAYKDVLVKMAEERSVCNVKQINISPVVVTCEQHVTDDHESVEPDIENNNIIDRIDKIGGVESKSSAPSSQTGLDEADVAATLERFAGFVDRVGMYVKVLKNIRAALPSGHVDGPTLGMQAVIEMMEYDLKALAAMVSDD